MTGINQLDTPGTGPIVDAIREFRWWNYGLDEVDPRSEYAEWVADLARDIRAALDGESQVLRTEVEQWRATYGETGLRDAQKILAEREDLLAEVDRQSKQINSFTTLLADANAEVERLRSYAETTRHHQQKHAEAVREVELLRAELDAIGNIAYRAGSAGAADAIGEIHHRAKRAAKLNSSKETPA